MLLLRTEKLAEGDEWLYELKLDGFRAIAFKSDGKVFIRSRNDKDFNSRFPPIVKALATLPDETIIDGEIVPLDGGGKPPLPDHPRCRGVPLGDGKYAGCLYGNGDLTPLIGPCDCPICYGSGFEGVIATTLPHQCFGDPDCCGCLNGIIRGDVADIVCNECEAVVRTLPTAELQRMLDEMELTLDVASAQSPRCGTTHLASGFSELIAFVCEQCGEAVRLKDDPSIGE